MTTSALPRLAAAWVARPLVRPAHVESYIPQQHPFAQIDTLYHYEAKQAWAGLLVRADNLLVQQGYLSEAGIIESMAQAMALKSGYEARQQTGTGPRLGFIAALKDVQIHALAPVGSTLVTHVEVLLEALDVLVIKATAFYDYTLVAQTEMRLFLEPLPADAPLAAVLIPATYN
jgi:3-hydroxyacyl-[acyl-carrier-protein] dehydratase